MDNQQFARIVPNMGGGCPSLIKLLEIKVLSTQPLYKWQIYPIVPLKKIPSDGCFGLIIGRFIAIIERVRADEIGDW